MITRRIELPLQVPGGLLHDVRDKLAYCSESIRNVVLEEGGGAVEITVASQDELEDASAKVCRLIESLVKGWRGVDREVLWQHRVKPRGVGPVWEELRKRGLVSPEGPGQVALLGDAAVLAESLDRRFVRIAREAFQAVPHQYPSMLSMAAMHRCHYFASFPQHVTFAPHLREDADVLRRIAGASGPIDGEGLVGHLKPPEHILSPAVCFHTYLNFSDRTLAGPLAVTALGRCFRYESTNFTTLERIWDFSLREIVFVGPRPWVDEQRERSLRESQKLVEELGVDGWIETANDPFFVNNFVAKKYFQLMTRTKYELQLGMPAEARSLAAASYNLHNDFFGRSFGIKLGGEFAFTGCVGFGLERWVWALFSQFGPTLADWPRETRQALDL